MTPCEHDPILHDEMQWNVCLATFRGKLEPDGCFFYVNVGSVFGVCVVSVEELGHFVGIAEPGST